LEANISVDALDYLKNTLWPEQN